MKNKYIALIVILLPFILCGQTVDNLRIRYIADSLYVITFDLHSAAESSDEYKIALTAQKDGYSVNPLSATGAGIYYPITAGKSYRILWSPRKEGLEPRGWGLRLKIYDPNPNITKVQRPLSDYPLVIAASYVLMFSVLWIVNLLN